MVAVPAYADEAATRAAAAIKRIPALRNVTLAELAPIPGATNAYTTKVGSRGVGATVFAARAKDGSQIWVLALTPAARTARDLLAPDHGLPTGAAADVLGNLVLVDPVVLVSEHDGESRILEAPPALRPTLQRLGLKPGQAVPLRAGINVAASVRVAISGVVGDLVNTLGITVPTAPLLGALPGTSAAALIGPPAGTTNLDEIDLALHLPSITPPKLEAILGSDPFALTVKGDQGKLVVGGLTALHLQTSAGRMLDIKAALTFDPAPREGQPYVRLSGPVVPLAGVVPTISVPGISIDHLDLELAVNKKGTKREPGIGFRGKGKIKGHPIDVTASLSQTPDRKPDVAVSIDGALKLTDLIGTPVPGLDTVMLERLAIARDRVAGTIRVGTKDLTGLVYTPAGKSAPNFALGDAALALSDFVPGVKGTPLDELTLSNGILLVVPKDNAIKGVVAASLPAELVTMLGGPQAEVLRRGVDLQSGVNVLAAVDVSRSKALHALLDAVGVKETRLALTGGLDPELFKHTPWKGSASGAGTLAKSFLDHLDIAVPLPALAVPGTPGALTFKSGALGVRGVQGKLWLGIDTGADVTLADRTLALAPLTLTVDPNGVALAGTVTGTNHAAGDVKQLVAFPGLTVSSVGFTGHVDASKRLTAALAADASLQLPAGARGIKLKVSLDAGDPKAGSVQVLTALKVNDFAVTPVPGIGDLTLTNLFLTPTSMAGTVRFRNEDTTLLAWTPAGARGHRFALVHDKLKIGTYVSAVAGTPLGDLELDRAAVIYVPAGGAAKNVSASALPAPLVDVLGGKDAAIFPLDLPDGVTVSALAKLPSSGPIAELLGGLGLTQHEFPLRGTLDPAYLSGAHRPSGGTWPHFDVNIDLPRFRPPGTGDHVTFDKGRLAAKPNADGSYRTALACAVAVTLDPQHVLSFSGEFTRAGAGVLSFAADARVALKAPFGIQWLTIDELDLAATIDRTRKAVDVSVGGQTRIDAKPVTVQVHLVEQGGKLQDVVFGLKGRIPVKIVPGLGSLPGVDSFVLVDPEVSRTHLSGEVDFRGGKIRAAMFSDPGGWNLLLETSTLRFDQLFPGLTHGPLKGFSLPQAGLVVSHHGFTKKTDDLPPAIQQMLAVLGLKQGDPFIAVPGVNIVTTLDPNKLAGALKHAMDHLGITDPVVLGGAVGGIFGGPPSLSLEAILPKMPTPPIKFLRTRPNADARLLLGLAPTQLRVGVGTDVNVHVGSDDLTFSADLGLIVSPTNVVLDVTGRLQGDWRHPFGIKGLTVETVSLTVGGDVTGAVDLAVGGQVKLGTNDVLVAAGASLLVEALGTPKAIGLVGKVDRLPFGALVDRATAFVLAEAGVHLRADNHPRDGLELDDVLVAFMTPGVVLDPKLLQGANLQIQGAGLAVAGRLKLDGKELGRVDGWASTQGLKLAGQVAPFDIGPVKVDKGVLDFQASTSGAPHFKIQTQAEPLGSQVQLDVMLDGKGISFVTKDKIGGQIDIDLSARTTNGLSLKNNDFTVHVDLKDDFIAHLRGLVAKEVNALFAELDAGEKKLAADLDQANAAVATREREDAAIRREVQRDRKHVVTDARQLRAQLTQLEGQAKGLRRQAQKDRADAQHAVRNWRFALGADLAAHARALEVEAAGVDAAYAATARILKAVEAGAQDVPFEADPRVLTALGALEVARAHAALLDVALRAARAVIADLRSAVTRLEHADVLEISRAKVDGTLGTTLRLAVDARVFGNAVTAGGSFAPKDAAAKAASVFAVAKDMASHLLAHKKLEHEHPPDPPAQTAQAGPGPGAPTGAGSTSGGSSSTPAPSATPTTPTTPATPVAPSTAEPAAPHMTYERWMKDTSAGVLKPRSTELKALDQTVKAYDASTDDTHDARKADVRDALTKWKVKEGPRDQWRSSARNKLRAVEILDAEVKSSSAPTVLTQQEKDALEAIDKQNRENLAQLFRDKRLVPKTTTAIGAVITSLSTFKTLRDSATQLRTEIGAPDTAAVHAVLTGLFDGDGPAARAALGSLFQDIVAAASPFGALMVANDWKGAVQAWQAQKKSRAAGSSFAAGDPTAAFDAMMKILERETTRARRKAGINTATFVIDTVLKGTGVGAVGTPVVAASKGLVDLFVAIHHLAIDSAEAAAANALMAQGKLDLDLFEAAPLLGAYVLAISDTSAVINMTVARFGAPGWTFEIESLVKKAQPVFDSATQAILAASYEIPELRHMKGATVNRNDKTIGLPTGKFASLKQRFIDWVNAPSSPASGGTGATAKAPPPGAPAQAGTAACRSVYRRDTRPPEVIFAAGFSAKGTNMDLGQHVEGSGKGGPSGYVSTTKDERVAFKLFWQANEIAFKSNWIYEIRDCGCGVDVNQTLDPLTLPPDIRAKVEAYRYQEEVAIPRQVDLEDVSSAVQPREQDRPPLIPVKGSMTDEEKQAFLNWPSLDQVKVSGQRVKNTTFEGQDAQRQSKCTMK